MTVDKAHWPVFSSSKRESMFMVVLLAASSFLETLGSFLPPPSRRQQRPKPGLESSFMVDLEKGLTASPIPNLFEELKTLIHPEPMPTKPSDLKAQTPQQSTGRLSSMGISQTKEEQVARNDMALGVVVSMGVLYALSMEGDNQRRWIDSLGTAMTNIFETTVPATTYDLVAVALGETLAGLTGAIASLGLNLVLVDTRKRIADRQFQRPQDRAQTVLNEAMAEGDYFLARAAVLPLLEGVGLPPGLATIVGSLLATLPYEMVKIGKRKRTARREENEILAQLLKEQETLEAKARQVERQAGWSLDHLLKKLRQYRAKVTTKENPLTGTRVVVDLSSLQQVQKEGYVLDGVELFADTCKWLSYSVLMKDFSGTLAWQGQALGTGIESGFYGLLATLTSQLYADFLYVTASAGPKAKRDQVRARAAAEWALLYGSKALSAFTLFGVYASAQLPVRILVNALLSGSIDSCVGSTDLEVCMETYYTQNPPSADDVVAQIRGMATAIYSLTQLPLQGPSGLEYYGQQASFEAQLRAIVTTLVSLMNRLM